ncbi:hypothetical protein ACOSQ3_027910 [Xanthoceras sorbifolium]
MSQVKNQQDTTQKLIKNQVDMLSCSCKASLPCLAQLIMTPTKSTISAQFHAEKFLVDQTVFTIDPPNLIFLISSSTIFTMRIQSSLRLCLSLIVLVAIIQSTSCRKHANHHRVTGDQEPAGHNNLSRTKYTSMFLQSFFAMLGSADHDTNKIHHLRFVSRREVPSGPDRLHN